MNILAARKYTTPRNGPLTLSADRDPAPGLLDQIDGQPLD
jgi:hypothetical protein